MAIMIPSEARTDLSAGEHRVFAEIKDAPGTRDWIVLHSLAMSSAYSGRYGEVDFVVLIPNKGIVCIEVKGGGVSCNNGVWTTTNRHGRTDNLKRSPFEQARDGMFKLLDFVRHRFGAGSLESRCPAGWLVVFPDAACPPFTPDNSSGEAVDRTQLKDIVQRIEKCRSLVQELENQHRAPPDAKCIRRLAEAFRPDFERPPSDANLIWHAENRIRQLTAEQIEMLSGLRKNPKVLVEGAAGTGKTVMAVETAREYSTQGKRVLLSCFNRNLGDWLANITHGFGPGEVVCGNLHRLLVERIMASSGADLLTSRLREDDSPFGAEFLPLGAMAIDEIGESFDVIIVDEAQDFEPQLLAEVLRAWGAEVDSTRVLLCGDFARQALYQAAVSDASEVIGRFPRLVDFVFHLNCRNTRLIAQNIDMTVGRTGAKVSERQADGAPVEVLTFAGPSEQIAKLDTLMRSLQAAGCPPAEIVILGPRRLENSTLAATTRIGGLPLKRFEDADPHSASYTTIHAFKGLERTAVILIDISSDLGPASDAILYVGMSRARSRLFMLIEAASKPWLDAMRTRNILAQMEAK